MSRRPSAWTGALAWLGALAALAACGASPGAGTGPTLTEPELKLRVVDRAGPPFYCDPASFPVAHAYDSDADLARLQMEDPGAYEAVLRHERLTPPLAPADRSRVRGRLLELRALALRPEGDRFAFDYATSDGEGRQVAGSISRDGRVAVSRSGPASMRRACPICLSEGTLIAAPGGPIPVERLAAGMLVWTPDAGGGRRAVPVLATGHTPAPPGHRMVVIRLAGGRTAALSPGHPLLDGRLAGELRTGDIVDGEPLLEVREVEYGGAFTWDLLPAGASAGYWANGVALRSTLGNGAGPFSGKAASATFTSSCDWERC